MAPGSQQLSAIFSAKKILRRELKKKIYAITSFEKARQSELITKILTNHDIYLKAKNVCGESRVILFQFLILLNYSYNNSFYVQYQKMLYETKEAGALKYYKKAK